MNDIPYSLSFKECANFMIRSHRHLCFKAKKIKAFLALSVNLLILSHLLAISLYQSRSGYFKKTAVDTLGFLFYKVAHCLYFTLGGENFAVFGHTLSGFYLLLHLITFCIQAIYLDKNCPSYNNNSTKLLNWQRFYEIIS